MLISGVSIFIPCYNEERRLKATLESIFRCAAQAPSFPVEAIVINDGSIDATQQIAEAFALKDSRVKVVSHELNKGLGAAIQSALLNARFHKFIIVPGDNDLPEVTLTNLLMLQDRAEVVMCFFIDREIRGRLRCFLSSLFSIIYETIFDIHVQYINGPSVYPTLRVKNLGLKSTRFSIVAEINTKLLRSGVTFAEIPSFRQTGSESSTAVRFSSIVEAVKIFSRLLVTVFVIERLTFGKRPKRISISECIYSRID